MDKYKVFKPDGHVNKIFRTDGTVEIHNADGTVYPKLNIGDCVKVTYNQTTVWSQKISDTGYAFILDVTKEMLMRDLLA